MRDALRGVLRAALAQVAAEGLPGEHHFFIVFRTGAPGVVIPPHLRAHYPDTITIILQHQFWDLAVDDTTFAVTLRFGGNPERLHVPFTAVVGWSDPAASLALEIEGSSAAAVADQPAAVGEAARGDETPLATSGNVVRFERPRRER